MTTPRQLRSYQQTGRDRVDSEWERGINRTAIVWPTGLGKQHPDNTLIHTPNGLRRFGDLELGDLVFGSNGYPTRVTGIFPNGELPIHRIHFSDHTSVLAGPEHLWRVKGFKRNRPDCVLSTEQLLAGGLKKGANWRWRIPMSDPVVRPNAELPIPAYTLGALIANGCLHLRGAPYITTPDLDVITLIKAEHVTIFERTQEGYCPRFILPGIQSAVKQLELNVPSFNKFIPRKYLEASISQRIALLRGLLDADGSSRTGGRRSVNYHTTSQQLANDVQELVWSLGGTASCNSYDRTNEGKSIEYALCILLPSDIEPFGTMRKMQLEQPRRIHKPHRSIVAITREGTAPSRCIKVAARDSLYLIGREYIVTHNTDFIADACIDEAMAGGRVLVIAHHGELLDQLTNRIAEYSPIPVGRIQANRNEIGHSIALASVQTMRQAKRQAGLDAIEWQPTLLVIDEVHHALAKSYLIIAKWAGCFDQRRTKLLGVTATLTRGDRQAFDGLFQSVADVITYHWAFAQGLLVPPVFKSIKLDRFWDRFRLRHLTPNQLTEQDAARIVQGWQRKAGNRITIAYCTNCKEAQSLVDAYTAAEIPVALVIGTTDYESRQTIYKQLAAGEIRVMVNVGVATEGFDCPQASCIIIDRPTESPGFLIQMIGRGLRNYTDPDTGYKKTDCLVLDTVGVTDQFDMSTLIDIDPQRIRTGQRSRLRRIWDSFTGKR